MNYITTTQLRTKSSELVNSLSKGNSVSLVHRSRIIGEIRPKKETKSLTKKDINELKKLAAELKLPKTSYRQRDAKYRKRLIRKYGQDLS